MTRLAIMAVTLGALTTSVAHALAPAELPPKAAAPVALSCVEIAPARAAQLERLEQAPLFRFADVNSLPARSDDDGSVPWCMSADDPRCSPMPGGSLPPDINAQPRLSLGATGIDALPKLFGTTLRWCCDARDAPRAGEHVRLDRPPRLSA